jgi:hypothetical protein
MLLDLAQVSRDGVRPDLRNLRNREESQGG